MQYAGWQSGALCMRQHAELYNQQAAGKLLKLGPRTPRKSDLYCSSTSWRAAFTYKVDKTVHMHSLSEPTHRICTSTTSPVPLAAQQCCALSFTWQMLQAILLCIPSANY
jgi:hypothetical protein